MFIAFISVIQDGHVETPAMKTDRVLKLSSVAAVRYGSYHHTWERVMHQRGFGLLCVSMPVMCTCYVCYADSRTALVGLIIIIIIIIIINIVTVIFDNYDRSIMLKLLGVSSYRGRIKADRRMSQPMCVKYWRLAAESDDASKPLSTALHVPTLQWPNHSQWTFIYIT